MKGIQLFTVPYETSGASACWQMMNFECPLMVASSADTSARSVGQRISGFHELQLRSIQIHNEQGQVAGTMFFRSLRRLQYGPKSTTKFPTLGLYLPIYRHALGPPWATMTKFALRSSVCGVSRPTRSPEEAIYKTDLHRPARR